MGYWNGLDWLCRMDNLRIESDGGKMDGLMTVYWKLESEIGDT